jgi:hypothetical protein
VGGAITLDTDEAAASDSLTTPSVVPGHEFTSFYEFSPANGEEWTLAIFGDSSWFADGSVIPDELPASFVSLLVGIDFDAAGKEVGFAFATIDTFSTNLPQAEAIGISAPATAGLAGLFLIAAARIRLPR